MPNKAQAAMDWLADTPEGGKALKAVADAGEALRKRLPVKLNNSELKYVMERLWAQRDTINWEAKAHFELQPTVAGAEEEAAQIQVLTRFAQPVRVRNFGFVILAAIPQSRF